MADDDVPTVEYQKVTPSKEPDALEGLGIEDVQYRRSKRQVPTERGLKLEEAKQKLTTSQPYRFVEKKAIPATQSGVRGAARGTVEALHKYQEWRKKKVARPPAFSSAPPSVGKRIAYINGKPVLVDKRERPQRAPRPQVSYSGGKPQLTGGAPPSMPQPSGSGAPNIAGDMHPPDITQGFAQTPRILDMGGGGNARTLDSLQPAGHGGGFDNLVHKGESGMLHMEKSGMWGGEAKGGGILGGAITKGGFLESLKIKGGRFW